MPATGPQIEDEALEELPCPVRVPQHDLKAGDKFTLWFSAPFSRWHVGKITEVNKRRTVSENVTASFYDATEGDNIASFIATAEEYGLAAGKEWAMLKDIPMVLSDDDSQEA